MGVSNGRETIDVKLGEMSNSGALVPCGLAALVALAFGIAVLSGAEAPPSRLATPAAVPPLADVDFLSETGRSVTDGAPRPDQATSAGDYVEPVREVKTKTAPLSGRPLGDGAESLAPRQLANGKSIFGY